MIIKKFADFNISEELKKGIADMGIEEATPIQAQAIPLIIEGQDVIGNSQTGSGKTLAFGAPAVELIDDALDKRIVQVLILCPTRELSLQACGEIKKLSKYKHTLKAVPIYGGESIEVQIRLLRLGAQVVVGTPGRIMDHMRRKTLNFSQLKMVILDEADEMLNMGFREDIETILKDTNKDRQTILFSATMPKSIIDITKRYQKEPKLIKIKEPQLTVNTIEQSYFEIPRCKKSTALIRVLGAYEPKLSLVFCNTKRMVDELVEDLSQAGYRVMGIHGDMKQSARTRVMQSYRNGSIDILVATDVAARGIDVNDIEIVFNFDIPQDYEYYVHRIGRTGRAGKGGKSFTFVQGKAQYAELMQIIKYTNSKIEKKELPTLSQINAMKSGRLQEKISAFIKENDSSAFYGMVEQIQLQNHCTAADVATALIAMIAPKSSETVDELDELIQKGGYSYEFRPNTNKAKDNTKRQKVSSNLTSEERAKKYDDSNMANITISIGKKDQVAPAHILAAVAEAAKIPGKYIGRIKIGDSKTTVGVPKEKQQKIAEKLNNTKINGHVITAHAAKGSE